MQLDKLHFLQYIYKLFLLLFRAQPDNPHCQVTKPIRLQCYPRLLRSNDILLAYSSFFKEPQTYLIVADSLYTGFPVYLTTIGGRYIFINLRPKSFDWMDNLLN